MTTQIKFCAYLYCFSLLLMGCNNSPTNLERLSLVKHFPYASRLTYDGFEVGLHRSGAKKLPAILQKGSGRIEFHLQLKNEALLRFAMNSMHDQTLASLLIQSDYTDGRRRNFKVPQNGHYEFPLTEFDGQTVRVTFSANSPVTWIDPVLEHRDQTSPSSSDNTLKSLRSRQANNNVLFILPDATSVFHMGCYGYEKQTTPSIDALARKSVLFENAISPAAWTRASTGSLLTGLYPDTNFIPLRNSAMHNQVKTIAESLRDAGYDTVLFTANPNASGAFGFGQGFRTEQRLYRGADNLDTEAGMAEDFVPAFKNWLDTIGNQRFFAYLHIREPHTPYQPPPAFLQRFLPEGIKFRQPKGTNLNVVPEIVRKEFIAAYDATLAYADSQIGKILDHLREKGLSEKTIIVILSDHGEAFWEHGSYGHFYPLYEENIRIPLIIHFPNEKELGGLRMPQQVSTIDLFPTLIDLLSLSRKKIRYHGRSILPQIAGEQLPERFLYSMAYQKSATAIRSNRFKFIDYASQKQDEFFDLVSDPRETKNIIRKFPILAAYYRQQLRIHRDEVEQIRSEWKELADQKPVLDHETKEQLKALGYTDD